MRDKKKKHEPNYFFINRELSWIEFNKRVLAQSLDKRTPILDQAKFSGIFSNNLDEFYMVRVASIKSQIDAGLTKKSEDGLSAEEQLARIRNAILPLISKQQEHFKKNLLKNLSKEHVYIFNYKDLNIRQITWVDNFFKNAIFPVLTPLAVDPSHPFPFISNLSLNIAAKISDPESGKSQFARVKVPQKTIPRFIPIPTNLCEQDSEAIFTAIPIEQIISNNLKILFPGMEVENHYFFRVTRDADLELRDIEADDLMIAMEQGLQRRRIGGEVVRLEVSKEMPKETVNMLLKGMNVENNDLFEINNLLALDDLIHLYGINAYHLKDEPHYGITHKALICSQRNLLEDGSIKEEEFKSMFEIISKNDILLHHPFHLFSTSVEEFIKQAAEDSSVMAIKMTLYRISKDSPIIEALIRAAENGKQVMALVELKARFDEDNNIQWAKHLEQSGVHVVYGVIGLKTHTKIVLVIRRESNKLKSYVHIGTGNYNSKTSKMYTDIGILSAKEELGNDLIELFNYLTGFSKQQSFRRLLVAPVSLRKGIKSLIEREIKNAKNGLHAEICAKMNSLVDPEIINLLYEASQAGVQIDLIIRGMCCLYPQKKGLSENIRVISIIGKFLEHSRIFWFKNNGNEEVYIGSADWMRRNLDRRIEAVTPIEDIALKKHLNHILKTYLLDNRNAWEMTSDGNFIQIQPNALEQKAQDQLIELEKTAKFPLVEARRKS